MAADVLHSANDILDIHLTDWRRTYLIIKANYVRKPRNIWFGLWCLKPLSNNISVISLWKVFLVEETGEPEKTTRLSQVTEKRYHMMLHRQEIVCDDNNTEIVGWKSLHLYS